MKLKREENTCYWCGSPDGPHPWRYCPANGKTCSNCGINDHFAKVCLENQRKPAYRGNQSGNRRMSNKGNRSGHRGHRGVHRGNRGNNGQRGQRGYYNNTPNHGQVYAINETEGDNEYYTDNYDPSFHHSPVFCLDMIHQDVHQVHTNPGKKYFANILTSSTGSKFHPVKFQIDTAATCNTMSQELFNENFIHAKISKSRFLLFLYGNSTPIKPIGQVSLVCERKKKYHTLTFQILPSHVMENKPPLLSGNDSEKLGLVNIHAYEVVIPDDNNAYIIWQI